MRRANDADRSQIKRSDGGGVFSPEGRVSADGTDLIQEFPSSHDLCKGLIGPDKPDPQRIGPAKDSPGASLARKRAGGQHRGDG